MKQSLASIKEITFQPSTIESIDTAMFNWLDNKFDLSTNTNTGFRKVNILWVSAERAFITKNKKEIRDKEGTMNYPLITLERTSITKDPTRKGTAWGNIPFEQDEKGGSATITVARRIKQDKSSEFANTDSLRAVGQLNFPRKNSKVVYETLSINMPVYIEVIYNIHIRTIYQQQMNELVTPFLTKTGGINYFIIKNEGHRFEGFIEKEISNESNVKSINGQERMFKTVIPVRILAYLIGDGVNQNNPKIVVRENAVDVKMPRERIILSDNNEIKNSDGFFGIGSLFGVKKTN